MRRVRQTIVGLSLSVGLGLGLLATPRAQAATQAADAPLPSSVAMPPLDSFEAAIARAQQLTHDERHGDALQAWQAAYALRQRPGLLLEIARSQQRLGLAAAAVESYRRFLTADPNPPSQLKVEAEQAIARLERLSRPGGAAAGALPQLDMASVMPYKVVKRKYHGGMRAGGISLFAIGYAAAFISGLTMGPIFINDSSSSDRAVGAGSFCLLIPVLGPFLSAIVTPAMATSSSSSSYYRSNDASSLALVWSLPWILTSGAMQVIGVGLWAGAYRHPQNVIVPNVPDVVSSLRIAPYSTPNGGGLTLSGAF